MSRSFLIIASVICTAQLVSAAVRYVTLSEEKLRLSEKGALKYSTLSEGEKAQLFRKYERQCGRMYSSSSERSNKYETFKKTLVEIDLRNSKERQNNGTAVFGVTVMSDLSDEEFQSIFLASKMPEDDSSRRLTQIAPPAPHTTETDYADWRGIYTTPIKYQDSCGSCWAFSAVAQIESDAILAGFLKTDSILSAQQMTKCTYEYDGCYGGFTQTGYGYVARAGGITTEDLYPYDYKTSFCDKSKNDYAVTTTMSYRVDGEAAMIKHVLAGRTLSISLDANNMGSYRSGIFAECGEKYSVNHAMNIVGVNVPGGYWILRNSWGEWWGDNGYMKLAMGSNMCGINNYPTYTDVALPAGKSAVRSLPTQTPTKAPTAPVAANIVAKPVSLPTGNPISPPTDAPISPTAVPTAAPTPPPTSKPTPPPSATPTTQPTRKPTPLPTSKPSFPPTRKPTVAPVAPTASPSSFVAPSTSPTNTEFQNTYMPIAVNTYMPVAVDTDKPIAVDTYKPSYRPSRRTRRPTRTGGRRVIPIVWPGTASTEKPN